MKFPQFKTFDGGMSDLRAVLDYLRIETTFNLKELFTGLTRLSLEENFVSFRTTVTIAAGTEVAIENKLRGGVIPTSRVIVRADNEGLVDGSAEWTKNHVFMKNTGASAVTATIIFLK